MALTPLKRFDLLYDASNAAPTSPIPRYFDQANQCQPATSKAFVFRFPAEIIAIILQYAGDKRTLKKMALVNRDFRQLARSRQFADIVLDYTPRSWGLLMHLSGELRDRFELRRVEPEVIKQAIFPCVRRIYVRVNQDFSTRITNIDRRLWRLLPQELRAREMQNSADRFKSYMSWIGLLVSNVGLGTQLEVFDFDECSAVEQWFFNFNLVLDSNIKELRLHDFSVRGELNLGRILRPGHLPQLTTLVLETKLGLHIAAELVEFCSLTLTCLVWRGGRCFRDPQYFANKDLTFPKLQTLVLADLNFVDDSDIACLLHAPLSSLSIRLKTEHALQALTNHGNIPTLQTLDWRLYKTCPCHTNEESLADGDFLEFFKSNPQLTKLMISWKWKDHTALDKILNFISTNYFVLTSLAVSLKRKVDFPSTTLHQISKIKSLQQVHLSASPDALNNPHWFIRHDHMVAYLSRLPNLKRLLFGGDTYENGRPGTDYYEAKLLDGIPAKSPRKTRNWELLNCVMVLSEADKYAKLMPNLDFIYFGQRPVLLTNRRVGILGDVRIRYDKLIQKMFGVEAAIWTKSPAGRTSPWAIESNEF